MRKNIVFTVNQDYINKYSIDSSYIGKSIVVYEDRYIHFERHKHEYINLDSYNLSVSKLFDIIKHPDFISYNTKNKSLEFIKNLFYHTLVAVRVSDSKELKVRSMYPITLAKKKRLESNKSFMKINNKEKQNCDFNLQYCFSFFSYIIHLNEITEFVD